MPVECVGCGTRSDIVAYRRPPLERARLAPLRVLLVVAMVASAVSTWGVLVQATQVVTVAQDSEEVLAGETGAPSATVRDGARLFASSTLLLFGILLAVLIAIPVRYVLLLVAVAQGHPRTLRRLRAVAKHQVAAGAAMLFLVLYLFGNTETISPRYEVGVQAIVGPIVLWYSFHPWVRRFFSEHDTKRLADESPAPPGPTSAQAGST